MKIFPWLLIIKLVLSSVIGLAFVQFSSGQIAVPSWVDGRTLVAMILVMPFVETVVFQFLVIEVIRRIFGSSTASVVIGCLISAGAFFLAHCMTNNLFNGLAYGLVGGVIYSVMYGHERKNGAQRSFALTWLLHAASNSILLLYWALFGKILAH